MGRLAGGEDVADATLGALTYGTALFGKIRIPAIEDGFVHVRCGGFAGRKEGADAAQSS